MSRSLLAVITGFLFIATLSVGTDMVLRMAVPSLFEVDGSTTSAPILLLTIAYVGLYATLGCYLAARMAPSAPMRHALVLGVLGLAFNVAGALSIWAQYPAWYHVMSLLLVMVWAWLGGRMREQEAPQSSSRTLIV
jgi:surface polysaccharide O-acyltransferase-like enzyme